MKKKLEYDGKCFLMFGRILQADIGIITVLKYYIYILCAWYMVNDIT